MPDTPPASQNLPPALRRVAWFMDESIRLPGGFRIGWDAIIGLIPGVGDAIGAAISGYIVFQAARAGAGKTVLARMILNVGLETLVGAIPIVGDIFDAVFKANTRNLNLLGRHQADPAATRKRSQGFVLVFLLVLLALTVLFVALVVWLLRLIFAAIAGGA